MRKLVMPLCVVNAIAVIAVIALRLPQTVATHFNYKGVADAWGSKWTYIMFAFLPLVLEIIYEIYRKRVNNKNGNQRMEDRLVPVMTLLFICIGWIMIPLSGKDTMNLTAASILFILFGVMMVFFSNYMGKIRYNRTLGLRVPWTLKSEIVWKKTHRLSGFTGTFGGLILIVSGIIALLNTENTFVWGMAGLGIAIMFVVVIPTVYSWRLYKKLRSEGRL